MTRHLVSQNDRLAALSRDKAALLEKLLEKKNRDQNRIRPFDREWHEGRARVPVSGSQQRLWFIDQLEGDSTAYHIPIVLRLRGSLDVAALQRSLDGLLARHESLRTAFFNDAGRPAAEVVKTAHVDLHHADLSARPVAGHAGEIRQSIREELSKPFDLKVAPLIRGRLLKLSQDEHVLIITMHHIVSDGWSAGILLRELAALYGASQAGGALLPLDVQYADYVEWQQRRLAQQRMQEQLRYWVSHLENAPELLELPTDRPRPAVQSYRGAVVRFTLGTEMTDQLQRFARRFNLTLAMTLYAAWAVVLSRLSGQADIVLGMPVANRPHPSLEGLIGFFVNTLAVRIRLEDDPDVEALLGRAKSVMLGAYAHQEVPFERLVETLQPARTLSHSPIFQTMFAFQAMPRKDLAWPHLAVTEEEVLLQSSHFDLTLSLQHSDDDVSGTVSYATDLFEEATLQRWVECLRTLLGAMMRQPDLRISELPLMSAAERDRIVNGFNSGSSDYLQHTLIHEVFEAQCARTPTVPAVVHDEAWLSYAELNRRANQVARHLREMGLRPDDRVALCLERSIDLVVGLLGILKAGGAYVPLDPLYPDERLSYMLRDCEPVALITQSALRERLDVPTDCTTVLLDPGSADRAACDRQPSGNLDPQETGLRSSNLAYIIYTSGSTGNPKGVMVEHRNVLYFVRALAQCIHEQKPRCSRIAWNSSVGFDMAVKAWSQLLAGRTVFLLPDALRISGGELITFIERHEIEAIECTPSHLRLMREAGFLRGRGRSLCKVLLGGEAIDPGMWKELAAASGTVFFNMYGPTECSVDASCGPIRGETPHIGSVMPNARIYLLDANRQPVPMGVPGEIYIGGAGVARGYLKREALTAERFLRDPFSPDPQGRMYRTGDVGRWRSDGTIEYQGRNDHQVKVRGYRIELGEIETQLRRCEQVKDVAVVVREDKPGDKRLVAYLAGHQPAVADASDHVEALSAESLRAQLKAVLPEYMVPSAFVLLPRLPMTANGKLDRRALPAPELGAYGLREYEAPRGEAEEALAGIWQGLLGVERVGRQDNFFELGGHSLLIMQMLERLRQVGLRAELRRVFETTTLAELAGVLDREVPGEFQVPPNAIPDHCDLITPDMLPLIELETEHIERIARAVPEGAGNIQDIYPLVPLQEGILFHHLMSGEGGDTYVSPVVLKVKSRKRIDALIAALQAVIDRHDILRTSILWEQLPRAVQVVHRRVSLPVEQIELDATRDVHEQIQDWLKPERQWLDLRQAPLLRLQIAHDANGNEWYAIVRRHHIVSDHITLEAIIGEIVAHLENRAAAIPKSVPYRNHVAQALAHARTNDAEEFFRGKLSKIDEPTAPFGLLDVHGDGRLIEESRRSVDAEIARRIRAQARRLGVSAATLFHAAWALVVSRTSARDDVVFGTVLLGRLQGNAGAQRILGMFINTLPLRLNLRGVSAKELVEHTQRELIDLLAHEQASLAMAQRCSGITGSAPLFTALLNYRHSVPNAQQGWSAASEIEAVASHERTNYPITVSVDDFGDGFELKAQTDRRIDPGRVTGYLAAAARSLVEALESDSNKAALCLEILPPEERQQVLEGFNGTAAPSPREELIHERFEEQVQRDPRRVAVVHAGESLSYGELNARASSLAQTLRSRGVGPDELVAVCLDRSVELLVGVMGTLKAGGAYVPLDPSYPRDRLLYMIEDSAPRVVLTQKRLRHLLPQTLSEVIELDRDTSGTTEVAPERIDTRALGMRPDHLAYVIYTSGSTGKPKGVMVDHASALTLWEGLELLYLQGKPCERVALNASVNFDASVQQILQLISGRTVFLVPQEVRRDASLLVRMIEENRIEGIDCTPSQLKAWVAAGLLESVHSLHMALVGGEPIDSQLWSALAASSTRYHNVYGPTECTVDTTAAALHGDVTAPHIGKPMLNRRVYILDARREPVPIGVAGEIYIGGAGIARGYLRRDELTAERFLQDPFSKDGRGRMYRTGDVGRWRPDGNIEYLGRNDHQVKVRGYRIELGEIEAQVGRCEQVNDVAVIVREDMPGEQRLVAYVVPVRSPDDGSGNGTSPIADALTAESLRAQLRAVLPEYMVPSAFVVLDRLPMTGSGKVDRRALPAPELAAYGVRHYEAPRGEVEEILAGIWQGLLGVERVGRQDNFFELGGHSLLIMQMLQRLRRVGLRAELRRVFETTTLAELARVLSREVVGEYQVPRNAIPDRCERITPEMLPLVDLETAEIERIAQAVPGGARNIQDIYPLVSLQEGILFHHRLSGEGGDTYVSPVVLKVKSRERLEDLIAALQAVIDRHDILRTAVLWEQLPHPVQVVHRQVRMPVEQVEIDPRRDIQEQITEWLQPEAQWLDLREAPLMRLQVAHDMRSGECYAVLRAHHIVSDHVTIEIVIAEVVAHLNGRADSLPAAIPYRNHVAQALAHAGKSDAESFFRSKLSEVDEPTAPFGLLDVHGDGRRIQESRLPVDDGLARRIRAQARRHGVSAATLFHAAWALVVSRTSAREEVVFGTVLLGRLQGDAGAQRVLGMFINTLPVRLCLQGTSAKQLVVQTQRELVELLGHEQASLAMAQRCSGIAGSAPLFTALLNYRHSVPNAQQEWSNASGVEALAGQERTNYPITVSVDDLGEGFSLKAQTDRRIDPLRLIRYLDTAVGSLVEALEGDPERAALTLGILPTDERQEVLEKFNATGAEYPRDKLIHHLVADQVSRDPGQIAVVHEGEELSYGDLDARANQLAHCLRSRGVGPDELVAVCVERSVEMVVGVLGILKAGGAYIPLDPNYPPERLQYMIEDAAPRVVLTQRKLVATLPATQRELIVLDSPLPDDGGACSADRAPDPIGITPGNLLYVIYTSGSTGRPKGTTMPHGAMVNLIEWHRGQFHRLAGARVLQFAALSFDVAFQEIFSTLCTGGTLVLLDEWVRRDARALLDLLARQRIERLFLPPLMLQALAECQAANEIGLPALRDVITAGEQLRIGPDTVAFFDRMPECRLHNHYGPTETHVVTALTLDSPPSEWPTLPSIGRPVANTRVYVLDRERQPMPMGVPGEIYIAGANVARGYLRRPELTAERFVEDPFSGDAEARMYRTGDLGRWRPDGTLEYLGRNDDQVKIRGYRIELGEIEARLALHPAVNECAVIAREDVAGDRRLVAYLTAHDGQHPSADELRAHLRATLPEHMIPSAFVVMDCMPLTPSGKLNRRGLPAPDEAAYVTRAFEAPQGAVEEALAQIWREILQVARIGRRDNFFELGGHSLHGMKLVSKVETQLNVRLGVVAVFEYPTVEEMAQAVQARMADAHPASAEDAEFEEGVLSGEWDDLVPAADETVQAARGAEA